MYVINLSPHCSKWWLAAWWHQAITSNNIDLSLVGSYTIHLKQCLKTMSYESLPKGISTWNAHESNLYNAFENYTFKIKAIFPRGQWVLVHKKLTNRLNAKHLSHVCWNWHLYVSIWMADASHTFRPNMLVKTDMKDLKKTHSDCIFHEVDVSIVKVRIVSADDLGQAHGWVVMPATKSLI